MYLGIETSSLVSSVALYDDGDILGELTVQAGLTHSEQLVPHIALLCEQCRVDKTEIEAVVVSTGPGSFTGLRIGMGTAKSLAYAWQCPIYGTMTLDGMAHNFLYTDRLVSLMIDAQKQHVYEARYRIEGERVHCVQPPLVKARRTALEELAALQESVILAGDGIRDWEDDWDGVDGDFQLAPATIRTPKASSLLLATIPRIENEEADDPMTLVPYYIRRSEAEVLWEQRHPDHVPGEEPAVVVTEAAGESQ